MYISVLTIAGFDSSCGAGIAADLKTFAALGCYGYAATTAVTAQGRRGVTAAMPVAADVVREQIESAFDFGLQAVKTGMLAGAEIVDCVAAEMQRYKPRWLTVDPVTVSTSGTTLLDDAGVEAMKARLLPLCSLLTPNIPEAERLSGVAIKSEADYARAARRLLDMGCHAVLIKGGHAASDTVTDRLFLPDEERCFTAQRVNTTGTHGTGCTLSAAIAAYTARGESLTDAIALAKDYLTRALLSTKTVGCNCPNHTFAPQPLITL